MRKRFTTSWAGSCVSSEIVLTLTIYTRPAARRESLVIIFSDFRYVKVEVNESIRTSSEVELELELELA